MAEIGVKVRVEGLDHLRETIEQAGLKAPYAIARALDEVGNKTRTQIKRVLADQTGVRSGRVLQVLHTRLAAGGGKGQFEIVARDVTLSLKEFAPRQTRAGVSAAPWKTRRVFPHSFLGPGGHVYERETSKEQHRTPHPKHSQLPIRKMWGPNIPKEMVKDQSEATFYAFTAQALPAALEKWLFRAL